VKILLATRNPGKATELRRILEPGHQLVTLADMADYPDVPETGLTFVDNAVIKAREGVQQTGLATIADDSGLCVDVLGGMPGVFSARWSGRHGADQANLELLLKQLSDVPAGALGAAFVCAATIVLPDARQWTVQKEMRGRLVREPRGTGGFGYDPIFVADGEALTNAELPAERKDEISHRGKAFRALAAVIRAELG
jgi:XTP/dITP diphosphohydrolase